MLIVIVTVFDCCHFSSSTVERDLRQRQRAAAATDAVAVHRERRQSGHGPGLSGLSVADPCTTVSASADDSD